MLFSVIVCTYNRADQLAILLDTLETQQLAPNLYEVLIIDNNSNDHTPQTTAKYCARHENWRYILEEKQGLSHARNRGWQEARAEYVAYIDDDCKAPPEWLSNAEKVALEIHPAMFGGPYYPFYQSEKPKWLKDEYYSSFLSITAQPLEKNKYLSGGNMFIKRSILEETGGFNPEFGMQGNTLGIAEETEFQKKLLSRYSEALLYCDPEIYVYHLVPDHKMKIAYRFKRYFVYGQMAAKQDTGDSKRPFLSKLKELLIMGAKFLISITIGSVFRDRKKYKYIQNYWFENCASYFIIFGRNM